MTQVSDIIQGGYREINLVGIGKEPTAAQSTEGLTYLNEIFAHVLGFEAGELLYNWPLGNYGRQSQDQIVWDTEQLTNPVPNSRLIVAGDAAMTVYLPFRPSDGARMGIIDPHALLSTRPVTLDGNGLTIEGSATLTLSTDSLDRTWLYRADTGNWARLTTLIATDQSPFPSEYDAYFKILLALRLAAPAGRELSASSQAAFGALEQKFRARYYQSAPLHTDPSLQFTSKQSYRQYGPWSGPYSSSQAAWNRGWPW